MTHPETAILLRYYQSKYNWTPEDIPSWPRHKVIWEHWRAKAHFHLSNFYESVDELPDAPEGTMYTVMDKVYENYKRVNGQWVYIQNITEEDCKAIYGE
jgi:hypothetical protein